jgi:hypothetical protein
MGVAGTAPVQTLSLPRLMMWPEALASISKTIRPGVADASNFCRRGIPAARRNSRESTIRLDASSVIVVFMESIWRGNGPLERKTKFFRPVRLKTGNDRQLVCSVSPHPGLLPLPRGGTAAARFE